MPETTEASTQSASDILLEAMSRSDIFGWWFTDYLHSHGYSAESMVELSDDKKRQLATVINNHLT